MNKNCTQCGGTGKIQSLSLQVFFMSLEAQYTDCECMKRKAWIARPSGSDPLFTVFSDSNILKRFTTLIDCQEWCDDHGYSLEEENNE